MRGVGEPTLDDLARLFGDGWSGVRRFHELLGAQGELRGLIGPRELPRLWSRHLVNSAAVVPYLPVAGAAVDVGTGAGLPGVVVALMRPHLSVHLVEPMQRRVAWLEEVRAELGLTNVTIHACRAEELHGRLTAQAVTARAVAELSRLARWSLPLLAPGGRLVVLKGRRAREEVLAAERTLRRLGAADVRLHEVDLLRLGEPTTVVELVVR